MSGEQQSLGLGQHLCGVSTRVELQVRRVQRHPQSCATVHLGHRPAGARPHTEWLAGVVARDPHGFVLTGPDVPEFPGARRPALLETSLPGVFAAGDVRARSVKRVAASVGEGSMSVSLIHRYLADALSPQAADARLSGSRRTPVSANRR